MIMKLNYMIDMDKASVWMLVTAGADSKENLPYVQELGDFIAHEKYYTFREELPSYLIKYTLSGEGELHYEGKNCFVPAGHFYWIDCRKPQYYHTSKRAGEWRVVWVHFNGAGCAYYYQQFLKMNSGKPDGELFADNSVASSIYALMDIYRDESNAPDADIRASAILTSIMAECIYSTAGRTENTSVRYIRQVQDYLLANYKEKITLDILAAHVSLNKFYLQKLFKQLTGQSPNAYLTHVRLNHAKEILRTTELPAATIAAEIGIENTSHFIKLFKDNEGVTPAIYRQYWRIEK